ncbi:hypothetical protein IE81DRAFT_344924 [Ceraceosorus guamensis]|uniref:Helicase C-terminal domain-containing protein n=1 Tax=Ceraceosorus guamensis TaxID=1522189 RepID=A0A316W8Y1_9BASI|nr:hypothetical protein IE81DRAFT_344924 [Ceraceosorus guamensis]PWN45231.1 hypothetical protein IE81DRAFT_344924 [Ceraceosorus guamensis]
MARSPPSSQGTRSGRTRVRVYQSEDSSDEELLRGPKKALSSKRKRVASDSESDFVLEEEEDQSDEEDEDEDVAEAEEEESTDERESTGTPALTESAGASAEPSEVTTPMSQHGNRFEVLDDDCFKNGTDPVVVAPIKVDAGLPKSSLAIATVTQGQSTKKFKQTRLSFGKPAAQSPAKSQSSRVRRATPDFIASDDDSDFGGPSKKRRKSASSTKSKPSTSSSAHWVPEFRKDRKVKYRDFVPDMPKATLMAAAAKDDALEGRLPPMHDLDDIFADIVKRCDTTAIVELAKTLQGRPLRVATMCSGTESPLLALNLMSRASKAQHGIDIEVHHVFSCEIEPYKQAYIERNFAPPLLFRDVCELGDDQAHTAYGALVDVPGDVDLLVAGTSCVDYSGLNNKRKGMEEGGESGRTFYGMLNWVERHKPAIVILENVKSAPWAGVAQAFVDIDYDAAFCNTFDTKHYYIPHTRQRGYLIATHNNKDDYPANWEALTKSMSRPASSTLESFLLPTDDPRIQHVRLQFALGEGYGKGRSTIDWSRCQGRHERARDEEALGKSRPFTAWEEGGGCKLSHDAWNEWALPMPERVLDLLDITTLRCAKEGFDPNFKSRVWELSQNVDRNIASSKPGTVGCLTPSGMPYLTSRGGPLVGIEALALQGLPIDELLLSRETNDQLQNLAGNAMSSTVVGTCVMAALLIAQPDLAARRQGKDVSMEIEKSQEVQEKPDSVLGQLVRKPYDLDDHAQHLDLGHLLKHAVESAQRCSCEGRTGVSDKKIFKCSACEHTACATCKGRPEHLFELDERSRQRPEAFEAQLKKYLPMRLRLQLGDAAISSRGLRTVDTFAQWRNHVSKVCQDVVLHFSGLLRQRKWTAVFLGNQTRLELILDPQTPHWDLYVEPNAEEASRGALRALLLRPVARMELQRGARDLLTGCWQLNLPVAESMRATITGSGALVPSWEANLGLGGGYAGTERWSAMHVHVDGPLGEDLDGEYELLGQCGTANGALHVKRNRDSRAARTYLFLDPHRLEGKEADSFVFAPNFDPLPFPLERAVIGRLQPGWRLPGPIETTSSTVDLLSESRWLDHDSMSLTTVEPSHASSMEVPRIAHMPGQFRTCLESVAVLACRATIPAQRGSQDVWPAQDAQWQIVDLEHKTLVTFDKLAWLVDRVPGIDAFSTWMPGPQVDVECASCAVCAPARPAVHWLQIPGRQPVPVENEQQAAPYEQALKNRPSPFVMHLRVDGDVATARIGVNALTLMHRALSRLPPRQDTAPATLSWKLSAIDKALDEFNIPSYKLRSNRADSEAPTPALFRLELRKEQRRSLSWMLDQEADAVAPFVEEEVSEGLLTPMGWRAEGKATRPVTVRGGVVADAVGYGKTAITLGLVAARRQAARERKPSKDKRYIQTKATLVIVPPHLCKQWANEVTKFTGDKLKVRVIHSKAELNATTIEDIKEADLIIMSVTIYKSDAYFESLSRLAAANPLPAKAGRFFEAALTQSLAALRNRMQELQTEGVAKVLDSVKRRVDFDETHLASAKRSKRLIGQAYADAHAEEGDRATTTGGKSKPKQKAKSKRHASDSEEDDFLDDSPPRRKAAKPKTSSIPADPWGLGSASARKSFGSLRAMPLECFMWERVVVDEFHYIAANADRAFSAIRNLASHSTWILSGTPPTADFADVKSIAAFLNIHLGVDDDADSSKQSVRSRREKERTLVERFRNFVEIRSPAWHHRRQALAQGFLDQFVRQNIAEIDEIPFTEHMQAVQMPAAERACYLELAHTIESLDLRLARRVFKASASATAAKKKGTDGGNDRDERLRKTVGQSSSPEEALSRQAAHFMLDDIETTDAIEACDFIVRERRRQRDECLKQLRREIREVAIPQHFVCLLQYAFRDDTNRPLVTFARNVENSAWGDAHCKPQLTKMLAEVGCTVEELDERAGRRRFPKLKKKAETSISDNWEQEFALRNTVHLLQRLRNEYWAREQSLRYFTQVRDIQRARVKSAASLNIVCPSPQCSKRGRQLELSDISLASTCGHTGCHDCVLREAYIGKCCTQDCNALAKPTSIVKASTLGVEEKGTRYGIKLQRIADLLRSLSTNDRVLLFVQYDGLLAKVAEILRESNISFVRLQGTALRRSDQLDSFQNGDERCLLLNIADESAAGSNLTVANHVIFLSPLIMEEAQQYHQTMEQARGRAIRFGQTKQVHIWRFACRDTIDAQTILAREGASLENKESSRAQ